MNVLAGIFLVAHGLAHLAIWLPGPSEAAPFDPRHSWLLGEAGAATRTLAALACGLLVLAGAFVINGGGTLDAGLAAAGALVSLALITLSFHPWLLIAATIDVAILVVVLA